MHRALIVDDEWHARVALKKALSKRSDVTIVGEADSVEVAAQQIALKAPTVLFLDVRLVGGNGFELFERVPINAHVIFVTAYSEYALRAFEVNALDYLMKPIDRQHVARALSRLAGTAGQLTSTPVPRAPTHLETAPLLGSDMVCLHEAKRMRLCRVSSIAYIQAAAEYTSIHLTDGTESLVFQRLRRWEERLPDTFVRIHRATLVNLELFQELTLADHGWVVTLRGIERPLSVSRRYARVLKSRFDALQP